MNKNIQEIKVPVRSIEELVLSIHRMGRPISIIDKSFTRDGHTQATKVAVTLLDATLQHPLVVVLYDGPATPSPQEISVTARMLTIMDEYIGKDDMDKLREMLLCCLPEAVENSAWFTSRDDKGGAESAFLREVVKQTIQERNSSDKMNEALKAKLGATKPEKSVKDISDELLGDVADLIEKAQQIVDGADEGLVNMVTPNFVVEEFNKGLTKMFSVLADSIAPTIRNNNSLARTGSYLAIEAYLECIALSRHAEKALTLMDDELNRTLLRVIVKRILASGLTETLADKDESVVAEWDKMATVFGVIDEDDTTLSTILAEVELEHGKALNDNQIEFLTILIHLANNVANYAYFREFIEEEQESQKIRKANKEKVNQNNKIGDDLRKKMKDFWEDPNTSCMSIDLSGGKVKMFESEEQKQEVMKELSDWMDHPEGYRETNELLKKIQEQAKKAINSAKELDVDSILTSLKRIQQIQQEKGIRLGVSPSENSTKDFHNRNMPFYRSLMGMSKNSSGCSCGGKGCKK